MVTKLNTSIRGDQLVDASISGAHIRNAEITPIKLDIVNSPEDGDVLTYDANNSTFEWEKIGTLIANESPTGSINGSNTTFTLSTLPEGNSLEVYLNGVLQQPGAGNAYTVSGTQIAFATAPEVGDVILCSYLTSAGLGGGYYTDHGSLTGLGDDDHLHYVLVNGSRAFTNVANYNSHKTFTADTNLVDKKYVDDLTNTTSGSLQAQIITDHGSLSGLADDDHTQYHNDTRGDARYYTQTQLNNGQLDNRYFTETEADARFVLLTDYEDADVLAKIKNVDGSGSGLDADLLDGHDSSYFSIDGHTHDSRYVNVAGDEMTGTLKISGTTKADGYLYAGTTDPTNSTRLNYDGYFYATKVYNAVYNDIADFQPVDDEVIYGKVYRLTKSGAKICTERCQLGVMGICSDTYGIAAGVGGDNKAPFAVAGWVLAYVDKEHEPGTPLTNDENGNLTEMTLEDKRNYPERSVAIYDRPEPKEFWGPNNEIKVNGRHWVKVK